MSLNERFGINLSSCIKRVNKFFTVTLLSRKSNFTIGLAR